MSGGFKRRGFSHCTRKRNAQPLTKRRIGTLRAHLRVTLSAHLERPLAVVVGGCRGGGGRGSTSLSHTPIESPEFIRACTPTAKMRDVRTAQTRTRPNELRSAFSMLLARELEFSTRSDSVSRGGSGWAGSDLLWSVSASSSLSAERSDDSTGSARVPTWLRLSKLCLSSDIRGTTGSCVRSSQHSFGCVSCDLTPSRAVYDACTQSSALGKQADF